MHKYMQWFVTFVYIKVIHVHLDLRKYFITLVWKDQKSLSAHHFIIIFPVLFVYIKFQSIIEL